MTPSVLSLCFRGPALCRWMPAAVFYHKSAPHQTSIKSPMGKGKKAHQRELIKTLPRNHTLLFCGRPYICCSERHGGLSARNRWETQWPFRAQTLGRRSGRGGESIGRTGFTELTESQGDCEGRAGTRVRVRLWGEEEVGFHWETEHLKCQSPAVEFMKLYWSLFLCH